MAKSLMVDKCILSHVIYHHFAHLYSLDSLAVQAQEKGVGGIFRLGETAVRVFLIY